MNDVLCDSNWVVAMQDELNQFTRNDVCSLVPKTDAMNVIGTKWVFRNKMVTLLGIRLGLLLKVIIKRKALILMKHMHL